jgi:ketosteroid isomerase-like protein
MRYVPVIVVIALLGAVSQSWAQALGPAEQELIKREFAWADATIRPNAATLPEFYADEYISTDQDGALTNKSQDVTNLTSGAYKAASIKLDDLKVHVYGDTAVVTGLAKVKATFNGKDASGPFRFTDVWVRRAGRWQCAATQSTLLANK